MKSLFLVAGIYLIAAIKSFSVPHLSFSRTINHPAKTTSPSSSMPLLWLYVRAELDNDQPHISWGTGQETNMSQFEVEQSLDGHKFHAIGKVSAAGNSTVACNYNWIDGKPMIGLNYYRIKEMDLSGKYGYSRTVSLPFRKGLSRTIAVPDPVLTNTTLLFPEPSYDARLVVYNSANKPIRQMKIPSGATQQVIDLSSCSPGVYFLQLDQKGTTEIIRVVKKLV